MRDNYSTLIVGQTQSGKTSWLLQNILPVYFRKKMPLYLFYNRANIKYQAIINRLDFYEIVTYDKESGEKKTELKENIPLKKIKEIENKRGLKMEDYIHFIKVTDILQTYPFVEDELNVAAIFDDCLDIMTEKPPPRLQNMLRANGASNREMFFIYHCFGDLHRRVTGYVNKIVCFETNDNPRVKTGYFNAATCKMFDEKMKKLKKYECFELPYRS
ncbi:MAG TPA: hypothetical protein VNG53_01070 [Bacteroidia bacterium]|nr:hypothetical protein [Bacteroidia bacterium]